MPQPAAAFPFGIREAVSVGTQGTGAPASSGQRELPEGGTSLLSARPCLLLSGRPLSSPLRRRPAAASLPEASWSGRWRGRGGLQEAGAGRGRPHVPADCTAWQWGSGRVTAWGRVRRPARRSRDAAHSRRLAALHDAGSRVQPPCPVHVCTHITHIYIHRHVHMQHTHKHHTYIHTAHT